MRKLLLVMSVALVAMTGCNNQPAATSNQETGTAIAATDKPAAVGTIAYINIDSLIVNYNLAKELQASYTEKATKIQEELNTKGRSLENAIASLNDKVNKVLITRADAETESVRLQKRQNELLAYRDQKMQEMAEEEQVMNNRIYFGITDYVKEFNADGRYDMILTTSASGPILSAGQQYDITQIILEGINKKYAQQKTAQ